MAEFTKIFGKCGIKDKSVLETSETIIAFCFATYYFTIGSKFVGNTKHLVSLLLFP